MRPTPLVHLVGQKRSLPRWSLVLLPLATLWRDQGQSVVLAASDLLAGLEQADE